MEMKRHFAILIIDVANKKNMHIYLFCIACAMCVNTLFLYHLSCWDPSNGTRSCGMRHVIYALLFSFRYSFLPFCQNYHRHQKQSYVECHFINCHYMFVCRWINTSVYAKWFGQTNFDSKQKPKHIASIWWLIFRLIFGLARFGLVGSVLVLLNLNAVNSNTISKCMAIDVIDVILMLTLKK